MQCQIRTGPKPIWPKPKPAMRSNFFDTQSPPWDQILHRKQYFGTRHDLVLGVLR